MDKKLKIALLFGGRSTEHEVSVISALQAYENLDKDKYEAIPVYVSKSGDFYTDPKFLDIKNFKDVDSLLLDSTKITFGRKNNKGGFFQHGFLKGFVSIDAAFPLFHGSFGEDGCVQGLFEMYQIPYVGFNVLGSAVAMDKVISKRLFQSLGFNVAKFAYITRSDWIKSPKKCLEQIKSALTFPVFIKPSDIGSTIGINKAKNIDELSFDIEIAATYSDKILIEEAFENCIEVNCAALGYKRSLKSGDFREVTASLCEMPVRTSDALSYEDKYMRGGGKGSKGKGSGMASMTRKIPAPIKADLAKRIQAATVRIFKELGGCGVARIDYFVNENSGEFFVNEVNTPPGSMAYYLFEPMGIPYKELLERVIKDALERFDDQKKTQYTFDSPLLSQMAAATSDVAKASSNSTPGVK